MIFTITSINKDMDLYTVMNEINEKKMVTSSQIVGVMCNGYIFTNAKLTGKGFAVITDRRTRYIQVPMNKEMQIKVQNRLRELVAIEEDKKAQMSKAINSPKPSINASIKTVTKINTQPKPMYNPDNVNVRQKIEGRKATNINRIIFRGKHYYGVNDICKKFNVDPKIFMERYEKGYTTEECLGLVPLRSDKELAEFKAANQRAINSMERQRGEF